jgi:hypothetical protein
MGYFATMKKEAFDVWGGLERRRQNGEMAAC